jgi:hypothetical protein
MPSFGPFAIKDRPTDADPDNQEKILPSDAQALPGRLGRPSRDQKTRAPIRDGSMIKIVEPTSQAYGAQ